MDNSGISFDSYYRIVSEKVRQAGFDTPLDRDTVREDYDDGKSPEESAAAFIKEWS